jgi:1,4-alpha-glucan branching enzyme
LHELDCEPGGFEWIDCNDAESSAIAFMRLSRDRNELILVAMNFTPVARSGYRLGVPQPGRWTEILNSDATLYGGSGLGNAGGVDSAPAPCHGHDQSVAIVLPPLALVMFRWAKPDD